MTFGDVLTANKGDIMILRIFNVTEAVLEF